MEEEPERLLRCLETGKTRQDDEEALQVTGWTCGTGFLLDALGEHHFPSDRVF